MHSSNSLATAAYIAKRIKDRKLNFVSSYLVYSRVKE